MHLVVYDEKNIRFFFKHLVLRISLILFFVCMLFKPAFGIAFLNQIKCLCKIFILFFISIEAKFDFFFTQTVFLLHIIQKASHIHGFRSFMKLSFDGFKHILLTQSLVKRSMIMFVIKVFKKVFSLCLIRFDNRYFSHSNDRSCFVFAIYTKGSQILPVFSSSMP